MRVIATATIALLGIACVVGTADAQRPTEDNRVERVRVGLQSSSPYPTLKMPAWQEAPITRFGFVTLLPPDTRGQFVHVAIPIGELTMRAGRAVVAARHRRAERQAREAVVRALRDLTAPR